MTSLYYADIRALSKESSSGTLSVMCSLFGTIHGLIKSTSFKLALAFPGFKSGEFRHPGNSIRVFSESELELNKILDMLEESPLVRDYCVISRLKQVPSDYSGSWCSYIRHRIPSRSSKVEGSRRKNLEAAEMFPYFNVVSKSTGQRFSCHINKVICEKNQAGSLCGYGLSRKMSLYSVPDLP